MAVGSDEKDLDQELRELEEVNALIEATYVPHPKQLAFHTSLKKVRGAFGGNRSGKSELGVNEARWHSTGKYPEFYPAERRWSGPTRGRIIVTDYKKGCGEVVEPKIRKWFQPGEIIKEERSMGNLCKVWVRHVSGGTSTFDIMTHEQDIMQHQGWNGHWVWCDEPPPRAMYLAARRGLVDFGGYLWITATPLAEPWMFDEIVLNKALDAFYIFISIYDNIYLTKEFIEEFVVSMTPDEREAMVEGKFLHLTGRVYKDLEDTVHVIDKMPLGWKNWPVWFVLDPADAREQHGIWAALDPFDNIYIFNELVQKGTIWETSKTILQWERANGVHSDSVIRILDPNKGNSPSASTGLKMVNEFATHAVYFTADVNDDIQLGHIAVREKLAWDKTKPISSTNHPKLYFLRDSTRESMRQMMSYVFDEWKGKGAGEKSRKEKPKDINKDLPDCIRYLVMSDPHWYKDDSHPILGFGNPTTGYGRIDL